jgi:hypothetical protein
VDAQGAVPLSVASRRLEASPQAARQIAADLSNKPDYAMAQETVFNVGPLRRLIDQADDGMIYAGNAANLLEIPLQRVVKMGAALDTKSDYYMEVFEGDMEGAHIGKVHPLRTRLQWVLSNWKKVPEVGIRTIDLILALLPNSSINHPPGLYQSVDDLVASVQDFSGDSSATLSDYADIYIDALPKRQLTFLLTPTDQPKGQPKIRPMNMDRSAYQWGYVEYVPWIAAGIRTMIKGREQAIWRAKQNMDAALFSIKSGMSEKPKKDPREVFEKAEAEAMKSFLADLNQLQTNRLQYIFDWVEAESPDLGGMDFDAAHALSTEWHNRERAAVDAARIKRMKREGKWFDCPDGIHPVPGKIVYKFENGWTMREMSTFEELQNEGNFSKGGGCLKHCVGESNSYYGMLERGNRRFLSLRDPKNRPFVTIEVDSNGDILQAKGLSNRVAGRIHGSGDDKGILKRTDGSFENIEDYLDAEALMLTEAARSLRLNARADMAAVATRVRAVEQRKRLAKEQTGSPNGWRNVQLGLGGVAVWKFKPPVKPPRRR